MISLVSGVVGAFTRPRKTDGSRLPCSSTTEGAVQRRGPPSVRAGVAAAGGQAG